VRKGEKQEVENDGNRGEAMAEARSTPGASMPTSKGFTACRGRAGRGVGRRRRLSLKRAPPLEKSLRAWERREDLQFVVFACQSRRSKLLCVL
jgi:hypothetical protein